MADLTFREQAAIAAMREEMRDSLGDVRGMPDGYHADIAREAWLFADAMDAERIKRTAMSEPAKAEAPDVAAIKAEARRDALRGARSVILQMARDAHGSGPGDYDGLVAAERKLYEILGGDAFAADPRLAELAKLRAVADAAEKFIGLVRIGFDPLKGDARKLLADMEHDLAGWRTKEGGR